jgi:hypothetical protein
VRSTLAGSPDAAPVTVITIPFFSGALSCLLPADLALRPSLAEEASEDAHVWAHCALGDATRTGPKVRLDVGLGARALAIALLVHVAHRVIPASVQPVQFIGRRGASGRTKACGR